MRVLVYDLEIAKAVPMATEPVMDGIAYCEGWHDHHGMGISTICAWDSAADRGRVFCRDNWDAFAHLTAVADVLVSFNGLRFDNRVLRASLGLGHLNEKSYDLKWEAQLAAGLDPEERASGFSLEKLCQVNVGLGKTGDGANAPIAWQRGEVGSVVDYCLADVRLTRRLWDRMRHNGGLRDPRDPGRFLEMRRPEVVLEQNARREEAKREERLLEARRDGRL